MTKLSDILDVDLLKRHLENRMVGVQRHPTLPLRILNYTQQAQFNPAWGDGTIDFCRGLIVDDDDNIVARPFKKFHNLNTPSIPETMEENLPLTKPEISKKLDGSLGILWEYDGQRGIATRGSFTSPQAIWATHAYLNMGQQEFWPDWTFLFEIIYPENRIVVKYDYSALVLIGAIHIETGQECSYLGLDNIAESNEWPITKSIGGLSIRQLAEQNIENEEGYVATYNLGDTSPLKIKIKMADYVRLHKIIAGMNGRSVWEILSTQGTDGLKPFDDTPEHFRKWLDNWVNRLLDERRHILDALFEIFEARPEDGSRKEQALYFQSKGLPDLTGLFFAMLDNRPFEEIDSMVWKKIKPRGDDKSFRDTE